MNTPVVTEAPRAQRSLIVAMSERYGMEPAAFAAAVRATCLPASVNVTNEQFSAFLMVANEYRLNPVLKEIYAYPAKGGGIQPIVGIDGWTRIVNSHPQFDGSQEHVEFDQNGQVFAVRVVMFRKDWSHPTEVTEYYAECRRNTDPWRQGPIRMLRHKAYAQCARRAFGFSGIMEPDDAERAFDATPRPDYRSRLPGAGTTTGGFSPGNVDAALADPETGEIIDAEFTDETVAEVEPPVEEPEWNALAWASEQQEKVYDCTTVAEVQALYDAGGDLYDRLASEAPHLFKPLRAIFTSKLKAFSDKERS